jgi:FAD:protein FMN transferase
MLFPAPQIQAGLSTNHWLQPWLRQEFSLIFIFKKMKQTKILMGMTIKIEISDKNVDEKIFDKIFSYFGEIDKRFSTYKKDSEISKINRNELGKDEWSAEMKEIFKLSEKTKKQTNGYFDIQRPDGKYDTSGLVKGWAIFKAADILKKEGYKNFYVDAGGDIQAFGKNDKNETWKVGIRNPFKTEEIIKKLSIENKGIATSGTYVRGQHIYNPKNPNETIKDIVSLTVVGKNVYEADRFATAAFAMGEEGIYFIENLPNFEGYMIDKNGIAKMTSGFEQYVI